MSPRRKLVSLPLDGFGGTVPTSLAAFAARSRKTRSGSPRENAEISAGGGGGGGGGQGRLEGIGLAFSMDSNQFSSAPNVVPTPGNLSLKNVSIYPGTRDCQNTHLDHHSQLTQPFPATPRTVPSLRREYIQLKMQHDVKWVQLLEDLEAVRASELGKPWEFREPSGNAPIISTAMGQNIYHSPGPVFIASNDADVETKSASRLPTRFRQVTMNRLRIIWGISIIVK
ncbi:hypothetical protein B0H14DRAFT_2592449 [Mycena olivaceomarginata]|nr:hypothetical protein B0H14DRAFT_2592449 [Mycena olivaceomarginata]